MDVRLPNGTVVQNVPDDYTADQVRTFAIQNKLATGADFGMGSDAAALIPTGGSGAGPTAPQPGRSVEPISMTEAAIQGAMAVPVMAGAARGIQALTRGSKAAPYAANLAQAVIPQTGKALIAEGLIGAASGVGGETAASQVPEKYGDTGRLIGGVAGGAVGAGLINAGRNVLDIGANLPSLFSSTNDLAQQIAEAAGKSGASRQAATALAANPDLPGIVQRARNIQANTGIDLPALAKANGDTTISSFLQSEIAKGDNSPFTAAVKRQYDEAERQLSAAKRNVAPTMDAVDAYVKRKAAETAAKNTQIVQEAAQQSLKRNEGLDRINNRIVELSQGIAPVGVSKTTTGTALDNLLAAKEKLISREIGPKYDALIANSEEQGIVLPGSAAKSLRDFVTDKTSEDVFNKFPNLYRQIKQVFKPIETPLPSNKLVERYPNIFKAPRETGFRDYSLKDLDSLKRETNDALRQAEPKSDAQRMLRELKAQVDAAIDSTDPNFAQAYRALDKEYATRLGVPFREEGVVKVNRAKFVEDTVPAITQRASSLKQVLNAIGDDPAGLKIVEEAFLFDISQNRSIINTNTGELNPAQLKRYLATNKDKIDQVPGLRAKLEDLGSRVDVLRQNRANILEAQKNAKIETIDNLWSQSYGQKGGIRAVVRDALSNPEKLDNLIAIAGKNGDARGGIQAAMLEDVLSSPGNRLELLNQNRDAFVKVFGADKYNNILDITEASQRLKDNPFAMRININTISKSKWEDLTGSKATQSLGELRNQVMSKPRVFLNHIGRYFSNTATKNEAAEVQNFLLDLNGLEDAAKFMTEINERGMTERALSLMGKLMKRSSSSYLFGGIAGGITGSQTEAQQPTNFDPALLEGFGQPVE